MAKDISQIVEFGFATWGFISSIYKSGWNKLTANKDSRSFRQYIALQFKSKIPKQFQTPRKTLYILANKLTSPEFCLQSLQG